MLKYFIIVPLVVLLIGCPLIVYNMWAWSLVALWFATDYVYPHYPNFPKISMADVQVAILGFGMVYSLWWGTRVVTDNIKKMPKEDSDPQENMTNILAMILVALTAPWIVKLSIIFTTWWFSL